MSLRSLDGSMLVLGGDNQRGLRPIGGQRRTPPRVKVGDAKAVITWPKRTGATGYSVTRNGSALGTTTGDVTFYVDSTATNGVAYTYAVSATVSGGSAPLGQATPATPAAATENTTYPRHRGYIANSTSSMALVNPSNFDVIICNPNYYTSLATLKAANPNTKFLLYQNASASNKDNTDDHLEVATLWSTSPESWFLSNASGRMTFADFSDRAWMDVGNVSYQKAWAAQVKARVQRDGWDGVFIDDVNAAMSASHLGAQARPTAYATDAAWQKAQRDFNHVVAWTLRDAGIRTLVNTAYTFSASWQDVSADILVDWDLVFQEYLVRGSQSIAAPIYDTSNIAYQVQRADWAHTLLCGLAQNDYIATADADSFIRYSRGMYYITADHTLPSVHFVGPMAPDSGDVVDLGTDFGSPTGARTTPNGANTYARTTSSGTVYVNATTGSLTLGGVSVAAKDGLFQVPNPATPATSVTLSGTSSYPSTPDNAAFDVVDVDCRVSFSTGTWPPAVAGVLGGQQGTNPNRRWSVLINSSTGRPGMSVSASGTGSVFKNATAAPTGAAANTMLYLRFVLDANNGASGYTIRFYERSDANLHSNTGWTQIGADVVTAGAITLPNVAASLDVGHNQNSDTPLSGNYQRFVLMDGIAGSVIADFDARGVSFTAPQVPTTYTDSTGKVWTMQGSSWNWNA